jgi:hypothetical protein
VRQPDIIKGRDLTPSSLRQITQQIASQTRLYHLARKPRAPVHHRFDVDTVTTNQLLKHRDAYRAAGRQTVANTRGLRRVHSSGPE